MKVVAINGSPRKDGNCAQMLEVLGKVLEQEGIEFEVCQPGAKVHPCMACYHCLDNGTLRCVQDDDGVNEIIAKCIEADGIVLASPVYHGGIAGGMKCVLDRLILAAGCGDNQLKHKVGAALCTLRRSGGMETYQQLLGTINTMEMVLVTSDYWNAVHGADKGEAVQDIEGSVCHWLSPFVPQLILRLRTARIAPAPRQRLPTRQKARPDGSADRSARRFFPAGAAGRCRPPVS